MSRSSPEDCVHTLPLCAAGLLTRRVGHSAYRRGGSGEPPRTYAILKRSSPRLRAIGNMGSAATHARSVSRRDNRGPQRPAGQARHVWTAWRWPNDRCVGTARECRRGGRRAGRRRGLVADPRNPVGRKMIAAPDSHNPLSLDVPQADGEQNDAERTQEAKIEGRRQPTRPADRPVQNVRPVGQRQGV